MLFLICVGYSSWVIANNNDASATIDVTAGDVVEKDYGATCYYVKNSEHAFDFYSFESKFYYTDSSFGFQVKIRPDLCVSTFSSEDISFKFSLYYKSSTYLNYFNESTYPSLTTPSYAKLSLSDYQQRFINSNVLSTSVSSPNSNYTFKLSGEAFLYSPTYSSLYSLAKPFQSGQNYVLIDVNLKFSINGDLDSTFRNTEFGFMCNLEEA